MQYIHDIFLSYRRNTGTLEWINRHFLPLLKHSLELELSWDVDIFIDEQLEAGTSWPIQLGLELGNSKIMIALWTATYLNSKWCTTEISHMLAREKMANCRNIENPWGLIIPVIIHDGYSIQQDLSIKEDLGLIQYFEISKYYSVRMRKDSPNAERLERVIANKAESIAKAIKNAPPWQKNWQVNAAEMFNLLYRTEQPIQKDLPKYYEHE